MKIARPLLSICLAMVVAGFAVMAQAQTRSSARQRRRHNRGARARRHGPGAGRRPLQGSSCGGQRVARTARTLSGLAEDAHLRLHDRRFPHRARPRRLCRPGADGTARSRRRRLEAPARRFDYPYRDRSAGLSGARTGRAQADDDQDGLAATERARSFEGRVRDGSLVLRNAAAQGRRRRRGAAGPHRASRNHDPARPALRAGGRPVGWDQVRPLAG